MFLYVCKQTFLISKVFISQRVKGVIMRNLRVTVFYMKTNVLQSFHICISVPLKQIEISIISKITKKIIKKEKCSYIFYFLLVALILFLFGFHFLQRGLMFHYIHTFILFKHAEFGKYT